MIVSFFSFIVGIGLAIRSPIMLRFIQFMNKSFSVRRLTKPLTEPHFVEPVLLKHHRLLGISVVLGGALSIFLLWGIDPDVFQPVYLGNFEKEEAEVLAGYTKSFLLVGNIACLVIGLLAMFVPRLLSRIESYTDKWYSLRKQARPLTRAYLEVDEWVLAHPTVSGVTLSVLSFILSISMYMSF